eukprot:3909716-Rhodomonas_salina.2
MNVQPFVVLQCDDEDTCFGLMCFRVDRTPCWACVFERLSRADRRHCGMDHAAIEWRHTDFGAGLDLVRTLLNLVLFLAHVAGWKAVWDVQDAMLIPWPASIALGIAAHFARPAVDRWLGTEHLAATSWFSHLAHLDDLSWSQYPLQLCGLQSLQTD